MVFKEQNRHSCCGWLKATVEVTKNMAHKINFDYSLKLLTNILENDNVNTRRPNKSELWYIIFGHK